MLVRPALVLAIGVALSACGPGVRTRGGTTVVVPARVTAGTYAQARRDLYRLSPADPERARMRDRLVEYLVESGRPLLDGTDYDAVVERFGDITALYLPSDWDAHALSRSLTPYADWLVAHGERRGDESRVLAALRVRAALAPDDSDVAHDYQELAAWGRDARAHLPGPTERWDGVVEVWEEAARLAPAPDVLDKLAQLYVERRDAYVELVSARGEALFASGLRLDEFRAASLAVARAPLDVAAVYLAVSDLAQARSHVATMGGVAATEGQLDEVLSAAMHDDDEANEALLVLARGYLEEEIGRPDVSRSLCQVGERRAPSDARFPRCLARVSAIEGDSVSAVALYEDAIRLEPDSRAFYDEGLAVLAQLVEEGDTDGVADLSSIAATADRLLTERAHRFPDERPTVYPERVWLALGRREMEAGDPTAAEHHLEQSIAARDTPEALSALALLCMRTGRAPRAVELYRRALDLVPSSGPDAGATRARSLASLGDALRAAGNDVQARRMWAEALESYAVVARGRSGEAGAALAVERGVLLDRLGRHAEAATVFRAASNDATGLPAIFTRILAHLVGSDPPDAELAEEMLLHAERESALPVRTRVYFALWAKAVGARTHASATVDAEADQTLHDARGASGWTGALARYGSGELDDAGLTALASGRGEETEAAFYAATRAIAQGRSDDARALLERVLRSGMIGAREYEMAQALSEDLAQAPVSASAQNR